MTTEDLEFHRGLDALVEMQPLLSIYATKLKAMHRELAELQRQTSAVLDASQASADQTAAQATQLRQMAEQLYTAICGEGDFWEPEEQPKPRWDTDLLGDN